MPKNVLLTGASGFVGSHVLRHLLVETDWTIICPVTFRHRGNSDRIASSLEGNDNWHRRVHVIMCDLGGPISLTAAERFGKPIDYILNVASESHVERSIIEPVSFVENNISIMLNILEYARRVEPKMFLQMSTDEIYGPAPMGHDHIEWEPAIPSNPYSASKAAQEAIAISYWRTYDVPVVITNTMNIIGEMQDPEKFVPKIMRSLQLKQNVEVHVSPGGEPGSRFYLHARNLANAWLWILCNYNPEMYPYYNRPGRFNIVGKKEVNNFDMVELVARYMDVEEYGITPTNFHDSRPGHDLRYALDGTKIEALGWIAPISFEESLQRTVEWTLKHPAWLKQ